MRAPMLPFIAGLMLMAGCDYVDEPVTPRTGNGGTPGETVKRRALLEEFTGHHCNNCPASHAVAAQLKTAYGEDLIVVGMHAVGNFNSSFIAPQSNPDGSYDTDFRTPEGQAYATTFGVNFLPTGMVNRTAFNSSVTQSSASWGSAIDEIVNEDAALDIWISALHHDAPSNTVTAEVKVAVLAPLNGEHNLTVYLLEDHVIDWQYNSQATPPDVPNYDHRHVFRKTLDGAWGRQLVATAATVGDTITLSYNGVAMNPAWNAANCELVAYAYEVSTSRVLQAAHRAFAP